jgi:hypothetical protein
MPITLNGTTGITTPALVNGTALAFRNKIINGAMTICQRYETSTTTQFGYISDRFAVQSATGTFTMQKSAIAPSGFANSLGITITSPSTRNANDYPSIYQSIEGLNTIDFAFGSSSANAVTLSFYVRSSVIGLYGGILASGNNERSYGFTYTISSANTWEKKNITIPGDTIGGFIAYPIDNTVGIRVKFGLGGGSNFSISAGSWQSALNKTDVTGTVGFAQTSGATFYITGVQLEAGSVATPFELRPIGTELALCERYFEYIGTQVSFVFFSDSAVRGLGANISFRTQKRSQPTINAQTFLYGNASGATFSAIQPYNFRLNWLSGGAVGQTSIQVDGLTASAEL